MNVNPANASAAAAKLNGVSNVRAARSAYGADAAAASQPNRGSDRVELSKNADVQRLVELAKQNDVRTDKVADLKAQIAAGTYDLDAKADAVADRLLDDLGV